MKIKKLSFIVVISLCFFFANSSCDNKTEENPEKPQVAKFNKSFVYFDRNGGSETLQGDIEFALGFIQINGIKYPTKNPDKTGYGTFKDGDLLFYHYNLLPHISLIGQYYKVESDWFCIEKAENRKLRIKVEPINRSDSNQIKLEILGIFMNDTINIMQYEK